MVLRRRCIQSRLCAIPANRRQSPGKPAQARDDRVRKESAGHCRSAPPGTAAPQWCTATGINSCNLNPGDLFSSGTLSTPGGSGFGGLLEISRGGTPTDSTAGGEERTFLEDGDDVIMTVRAAADGFTAIGLGECRDTVEGARPDGLRTGPPGTAGGREVYGTVAPKARELEARLLDGFSARERAQMENMLGRLEKAALEPGGESGGRDAN